MRTSRIWIALIIALAFFLMANAPAQILKPYLSSLINFPFTISGTIWKGDMSSKHFQRLSWQIDPIFLILGKVSSKINLEIDNINKLSANAEIGLFSKLELNTINGVITTKYLQQFSPNTTFLLSSNINISQTNVKWSDQLPPNLPSKIGGIFVLEKVNFLGENLGDYRFNFLYSDRSLEGDISSTSNSAVEASIKVSVSKSKLLSLDGVILPKTIQLQSIFRELNISLKPRITYQLNY